jgi:hypothetical protein
VGVVASAFVLLRAKDSAFTGALSGRCSSLPALTVYRIGGVVNFLAEKGLIDPRAVAAGVTGEYPQNRPEGDAGREGAITSVQNALRAMNITANLNAAMSCVVGIQEAMVMLGVDKIMGAGHTTLQNTYGAYKTASTGYDYAGKTGKARDKIKQLKEFIDSQRGSSVDIFINAM